MSKNPFDDEEALYHVLINGEGQYSLWPAFAIVPDGWRVVVANVNRSACLEHVANNWSDMRPYSVRRSF